MVSVSEVEVTVSCPRMLKVRVMPLSVMVSEKEMAMIWLAVALVPRVKVPVSMAMVPGPEAETLPAVRLRVSPEGAKVIEGRADVVTVMVDARAGRDNAAEVARKTGSKRMFKRSPSDGGLVSVGAWRNRPRGVLLERSTDGGES